MPCGKEGAVVRGLDRQMAQQDRQGRLIQLGGDGPGAEDGKGRRREETGAWGPGPSPQDRGDWKLGWSGEGVRRPHPLARTPSPGLPCASHSLTAPKAPALAAQGPLLAVHKGVCRREKAVRAGIAQAFAIQHNCLCDLAPFEATARKPTLTPLVSCAHSSHFGHV